MKRRGILAIMLAQAPLLAHAGEPLQPHDLWSAWRFDPGTAIPLAISAALYMRGARISRGATRMQTTCFWAGWITLVIALVSPLHPLGEALFSAHMAQHEILMLIAAPLLVLSRPLAPMLWGMPAHWRRTVGRWSKWSLLSAPLAAWWIHAIALWVWHAPPLFQATLDNEWIHAAQHASFFLSALLFWWALLYARGRRGYGVAVLYIFTTTVHTSILGALLTLVPKVLYPSYVSRVAAWGLTPIEDQQIGGLIMWVPAGLVYLAAGLWLVAAWLRELPGGSDESFGVRVIGGDAPVRMPE